MVKRNLKKTNTKQKKAVNKPAPKKTKKPVPSKPKKAPIKKAIIQKIPKAPVVKVKKPLAVKTKKVPAPKQITTPAQKRAHEQLQKADKLLKRGKERGYVTYDEILKDFPTIETDLGFLEELYEKFTDSGVDVLENSGLLSIDVSIEENKYSYKSSGQYDSIQIYLKEIGQYSLIKASEEKDLAKRIEVGDQEAKMLLARANLRLVVSIAKKYVGRSPDLTLLE
jgi:hypothetical protein